MRKLTVFRVVGVLAALAVVAVVGPAQAEKPNPPKAPQSDPPKPNKCVSHHEGYNASGTLVLATLTSPLGNGRYNGPLEVNVTKANHHGATGIQKYALTEARVKFHHGVSSTAPEPGSRVKLHGKITELPKGCPTTGFTSTITIKKVDIKKAKK
jgi:hypothetical protein